MAKQMTMDSQLSEVYVTPIGRDTIGKVLMQLAFVALCNNNV